jgi:hypothetical protein
VGVLHGRIKRLQMVPVPSLTLVQSPHVCPLQP